MANPQVLETSGARNAVAGAADVLIAVPSPTQASLLQQRVSEVASSLGTGQLRFAVAYPGIEGTGLLAQGHGAGRDESPGPRWSDEGPGAADSFEHAVDPATTLPMI